MGSYLATWSVFVIDDNINDPVAAARAARARADDHANSMWGVEDLAPGANRVVSVDLEAGEIVPLEDLGEDVA